MTQPVSPEDPIDHNFPTGPAVGELVPDFVLPDQHGSPVRFSTVRGTGQALILFHRSASW